MYSAWYEVARSDGYVQMLNHLIQIFLTLLSWLGLVGHVSLVREDARPRAAETSDCGVAIVAVDRPAASW